MYVEPTLAELSKLSEEELAAVPYFAVGHEEHGWVRWDGETDVRGLRLDDIVHFSSGEVSVYPEEEWDGSEDRVKPEVGSGLNKPAVVCLARVFPLDEEGKQLTEPSDVRRFRDRLEAATNSMDSAEFLAYEEEEGNWVFRVAHFSRYGLPAALRVVPSPGRAGGASGDEQQQQQATEVVTGAPVSSRPLTMETERETTAGATTVTTIASDRPSFGRRSPARKRTLDLSMSEKVEAATATMTASTPASGVANGIFGERTAATPSAAVSQFGSGLFAVDDGADVDPDTVEYVVGGGGEEAEDRAPRTVSSWHASRRVPSHQSAIVPLSGPLPKRRALATVQATGPVSASLLGPIADGSLRVAASSAAFRAAQLNASVAASGVVVVPSRTASLVLATPPVPATVEAARVATLDDFLVLCSSPDPRAAVASYVTRLGKADPRGTFSLMSTLFGADTASSSSSYRTWLQRRVQERQLTDSRSMSSVFRALRCGQTDLAVQAAVDAGKPRLATLLAQRRGIVGESGLGQVEPCTTKGCDGCERDVLSLLAGRVCDVPYEGQWESALLCVALFAAETAEAGPDNLAAVLGAYSTAVARGQLPKPASRSVVSKRDAAFFLLALKASPAGAAGLVDNLAQPGAYETGCATTAWLTLQTLQVLGVLPAAAVRASAGAARLGTRLATELAAQGEWQVGVHVAARSGLTGLVAQLLDHHAVAVDTMSHHECCVPRTRVEETLAVRAAAAGDTQAQIGHLVAAGAWRDLHELLVSTVAPRYVLSHGVDGSSSFAAPLSIVASALAEHTDEIADWHRGLATYLDVAQLQVERSRMRDGRASLDELAARAARLSTVLGLLPAETAEQRAAASALSSVVAQTLVEVVRCRPSSDLQDAVEECAALLTCMSYLVVDERMRLTRELVLLRAGIC
jgi:hypothetical protein